MYTASLTTGASSGFWMVFDAAAAPADGALRVAPKYCWPWPANTGGGWAWPNGGIPFQNGLTMVFSTGADCLHKTGSQTAFWSVQVQQ
jgi:hypothetical protein